MKLVSLIMVRVITSGLILVCMALTSSIYGFDTRFASGKSALAIPFELVDSHIFLRISVNGSRPLSFILDTGASHTILSLRNAKALGMGLQQIGKVEGGIGDEPPDAYLVTDTVSFSLPGVVHSGESVVTFSLDKTQECLDHGVVDGILGMEFFSTFVVEIDYPARLINLHDPHTYKYSGSGKILPLEMDLRRVFVRARVKAPRRPPTTARLLVDTGAGALSLTKQFAEAHKLLPPAEKLTVASECGSGGLAREVTLVGPLEALQLGGFRLSNPLTVFYQQTAARTYDGLLGGVALRNFKVIFDYSRSRMILEPPRRIRRQ